MTGRTSMGKLEEQSFSLAKRPRQTIGTRIDMAWAAWVNL